MSCTCGMVHKVLCKKYTRSKIYKKNTNEDGKGESSWQSRFFFLYSLNKVFKLAILSGEELSSYFFITN